MTASSDDSAGFQRQHPSEGMQALEKERQLPLTGWQTEVDRAREFGLDAAASIVDRRISTFSRGELPHYAGINTFMKAPYLEDVNQVGNYDVAVLGVPHDSGTTYRPGTRFGPQGIRRISALYTPYNYEMGVDLREQIRLCDVGDIFTIPANNEKSFDQISKGVAHVFASGAFPIILGGDHSIGFPTVRGVCRHLGDRKVGIIHFDRHVDTQETDLDERMHTSLVPRHQHGQRPCGESRATGHRRLAGSPRGCEGLPRTRHQCAHGDGYHRDGAGGGGPVRD